MSDTTTIANKDAARQPILQPSDPLPLVPPSTPKNWISALFNGKKTILGVVLYVLVQLNGHWHWVSSDVQSLALAGATLLLGVGGRHAIEKVRDAIIQAIAELRAENLNLRAEVVPIAGELMVGSGPTPLTTDDVQAAFLHALRQHEAEVMGAARNPTTCAPPTSPTDVPSQ